MPALSQAGSPRKKQAQILPSCRSEQRAKAAAPSPTQSRRLQEVNPSDAGRKEANWQLFPVAASPKEEGAELPLRRVLSGLPGVCV